MTKIVCSAAVFAALTVPLVADLHAEAAGGIVRVYDASGLADDVRETAIRVGASIVATAGTTMEWRDCTRSRTPECLRTEPARDLIVRILPTVDASTLPRPERLDASASPADPPGQPLGLATINDAPHMSRSAAIFRDPVHQMARRAGLEPGVLFGRTLAHEVGHLLLGVHEHSRRGLMRAVWTDAELISNRFEDWVFSAADRQRLRLRANHIVSSAGNEPQQVPHQPLISE